MLELNELKAKTLVELREIAKNMGIPKYLGLRKAELIEKLMVEMKHEVHPPAEPPAPAAAPAPKRGRPRKTVLVPQPDIIAPESKQVENKSETDSAEESGQTNEKKESEPSAAVKPATIRRGRPRKITPVPQPDPIPVENKQEPIETAVSAAADTIAERTAEASPAAEYTSVKEGPTDEDRTAPADEHTPDSKDGKPSEPAAQPIAEKAEEAVHTASDPEWPSKPDENAEGKRPAVRRRPEGVEEVDGILEVMADGYGFLRFENYMASDRDVYVSPIQIRRFNLKTGDRVLADVRPKDDENKFRPLLFVHKVNGDGPEVAMHRRPFDSLTPIYPDERMRLEVTNGNNDYATRLIDLIAPIGKGQRGIIVSPPKAGKTTLLKRIANAITVNFPESELIVLLVDERPEEVTDMKRSIHGDVIYSTFDEQPEHHAKVAELVLERAMRLAEHKRDVVILLDSLTRLTRAYNLIIPPSGRTLTGGIDPAALYKPKRFFGAARNIEEGGSITILATALVETGSRMDDVIFEEFKGTGNMELKLDRALQEKRVFPAIDIKRSGTRREESLLTEDELNAVWAIRKLINTTNSQTITEELIHMLVKTPNNERLVNQILAVYSKK